MKDDLSELLQHECDHLYGILCTMRAIDEKSFKWRP
jgi:peptide deformylase